MSVDVELLTRFNADRALACQVLFPHRHPDESPDFHVEIVDLWSCADEFVLIEAFREGGKTTKAEEWLTLGGCFGNFNYWLLLGETYSKACQRLAAIDYEARTNKLLARVFGPPLRRRSIENKVWFSSGAMIEAMGWEQELQGLKEQAHRPEGAYLDDIENAERVRDKAAVDASIYKLFFELMPALDKKKRRIRFGQVRRAEDCMVTRLAKNPNWLYRGYPICDGDIDDPLTKSLWPSRYPMEWIRKERANYQDSGAMGAFLQSYMLQATNPSSKPFTDDMFTEMDVSPWHHWMPRYAIYDPSRTTNPERKKGVRKSDRTGKVVVSRLGSKIMVHESGGHFWQPNELVDDMFRCNETHSPAKIGIEKNSLDDWLMQPIRIEMLRRGAPLPLVVLQAPQDRSKEDFIMGLQPFAHAKDIVLIGGKAAHPQLVAEWANFPFGPRDVLNALAYSLRMFSGVPMYEDFSGRNVADAPAPKRGEEVYVGFNATPSEVVAVAVIRDGRRLCVAADWSASGATADAVKTLVFGVRSTFPQAAIQAWVPADTFDQWQRVALVPALRAEKLSPYRAEHTAVARGCLAERIRMVWHNAQMLTVDRNARLTLNVLSTGYAFPTEKGGRQATEPEPGLSRLAGEALECMAAILDRTAEAGEDGFPAGANIALTPAGVPFVSANPRARA